MSENNNQLKTKIKQLLAKVNNKEIDFHTIDDFVIENKLIETQIDYLFNTLKKENIFVKETFLIDEDNIDFPLEVPRHTSKTSEEKEVYIKSNHNNIDLISIYFKEASKTPLLNYEEEKEIATKAKKGDPEAIEKMLNANLRLVISLANNFKSPEFSLLDAIQEGNIGLMHAIKKFDPKKGFKFSTYATFVINSHIRRALSQQSRLIRIPVYMLEKMSLVNKTKLELSQLLNKEPTLEQIVEALKGEITLEQLKQMEKYYLKTKSLSIVSKDGSTELENLIPDNKLITPEQHTSHTYLNETVVKALEVLNENEKKVVILRFGIEDGKDRTLAEIGKILNLSKERIRQIEKKALEKLKDSEILKLLEKSYA